MPPKVKDSKKGRPQENSKELQAPKEASNMEAEDPVDQYLNKDVPALQDPDLKSQMPQKTKLIQKPGKSMADKVKQKLRGENRKQLVGLGYEDQEEIQAILDVIAQMSIARAAILKLIKQCIQEDRFPTNQEAQFWNTGLRSGSLYQEYMPNQFLQAFTTQGRPFRLIVNKISSDSSTKHTNFVKKLAQKYLRAQNPDYRGCGGKLACVKIPNMNYCRNCIPLFRSLMGTQIVTGFNASNPYKIYNQDSAQEKSVKKFNAEQRKSIIQPLLNLLDQPMWIKVQKDFSASVYVITFNSSQLNPKKQVDKETKGNSMSLKFYYNSQGQAKLMPKFAEYLYSEDVGQIFVKYAGYALTSLLSLHGSSVKFSDSEPYRVASSGAPEQKVAQKARMNLQ